MLAGLLAARLGKPALVALALGALFALAGLGAWRAAVSLERMLGDAALAAREERDAHWRAEIAASNLAVERARAEQALAAAQAQAQASAAAERFQSELNTLETANAALADGARCGLGRDRVRLLNGAR